MSNIEANYIISSTRPALLVRETVRTDLARHYFDERELYDYLMILFSLKASESETLETSHSDYFHFPMYNELGFPPFRAFYRSVYAAFLVRLIADLNAKEAKIVFNIILKFFDLNSWQDIRDFISPYILNEHKYTFEDYQDSIEAFRTFAFWLDIELSQALMGGGSRRLYAIHKFVKTMLDILPGRINTSQLPQTAEELIQMYNPEFATRFADVEVIES